MDMIKVFAISTGEKFAYDSATNKIIMLKGRNTAAAINEAVADRIILNREFSEIRFGMDADEYIRKINICLPRLVLEITQQCNLRCRYCVYSGNYSNTRVHCSKIMTWDIVKESIDFYAEHSCEADKADISFYGGEALLEFEMLKKAVAYAKRIFNNKPLSIGISSNGTLISKAVAEWLAENPEVKVTLTLNGPYHDLYRVFENGQGSIDIITDNLQRLKATCPSVLEKQISFICNISTEAELLGMREFYMNKIGQAPTLITKINLKYGNEFIKSMTEIDINRKKRLHKGIEELYLKENDAFLHSYYRLDMFNITQRCIPKTAIGMVGTCLPFLSQLFIDAEGKFAMCEKLAHRPVFGDVQRGFDVNALKKLYAETINKFNDHCKSCWAQRLCTLCYKDLLSMHTAKFEFDEADCENMRSKVLNQLKMYCEIAYNYPEVMERYKIEQ